MCPSFQVCSDTWSPADGVFRKVAKPLEDGVLLEEVGHWGWDLRFSSLPPLPVHLLLPDCTCHVASCQSSWYLNFYSIMDCIPWNHDGKLYGCSLEKLGVKSHTIQQSNVWVCRQGEKKIRFWRDHLTPMPFIYNSQDVETIQVSING